MESLAFAAVLLAAVMHASWNVMVKINASPLIAISIMFGLISTIVLVYIPWLPALPLSVIPYLVLSLVCHFGYKIYLVRAFSLGNFSQSYPISRGSAPLWVLLFSTLFLAADLSTTEVLGVVLIIFGIFTLASWHKLVGKQPAIMAALITGCWIAAYTLIDGYVVQHYQVLTAFVFWLFFLDGLIINLYALINYKQQLLSAYRHYWHIALLGGGFSLGAYSISLWAMTLLPIAMVSALRETSVLVAVLFARLWLKEPLSKRHYGAAILIFVGLMMSKLSRAG